MVGTTDFRSSLIRDEDKPKLPSGYQTPDANINQPASKFLDIFVHDVRSTNWTYRSEWSSNYTVSNLPGPGRNLGNLYSQAGKSLERNLGRLAYNAGIGRFAKAEKMLRMVEDWNINATPEKEREVICKALVDSARMNDPAIQALAFRAIFRAVASVAQWPQIQSVFRTCCTSQGEPVEVAIFSWKRSGIEYSSEWLYFHRLVSLCLTSNPVMDAVFRISPLCYVSSFVLFDDILKSCRDFFDTMLAIEFVGRTWNHLGIDSYFSYGNYRDNGLMKLVVAIQARFEIAKQGAPLLSFADYHLGSLTIHLISEVCQSLANLPPGEVVSSSENKEGMALMTEIYFTYCATQSNVGRVLTPYAFKLHEEEWKLRCESWLPDTQNTKARELMMRFEDIHGSAARERFPLAARRQDGSSS